MIDNWNSVVAPGDRVYHLGDIYCGRITLERAWEIHNQLNGQIFLILGNHDKIASHMQDQPIDKRKRPFVWVQKAYDLKVDDLDAPAYKGQAQKQHIVLYHYCQTVWQHSYYGSWQLFGHSHHQIPVEFLRGRQMDVGVDGHNFTPISYDHVKFCLTPVDVFAIDYPEDRVDLIQSVEKA